VNGRAGCPYAQLHEKLAAIHVDEREVNVRNKLSSGKFMVALFLQCLAPIETTDLRL